jgi:hypothetical protein
MATLARRLRQRLGVTSLFMLSGLVGTLCGSGCGAPSLFSFPPQVAFISNGQYEGTLQSQGITLPITGTLQYLTGQLEHIKLHVSVDTGNQQITSDSWVTRTPTVINEWEILSTDPTTCRKEVLSGDSYPRCTAWNRTPTGAYSLECTVTVLGNKATLDVLADLSDDNKLVQLQQNTAISDITDPISAITDSVSGITGITGLTDSITIIMTEQGTTPPVPSDFDLPSICNQG